MDTRRAFLACLALAALLVLPGCDPEPATTYPVTGEECGPDDPVRELANCPIVSGAGV
ncbi:MAG: hypothetical protein NXH97_01165 [Rhodobacteraceae bacterium]|nr:hypothetical protein [Paracoccaceae bacterium]